MTVGSCVKTERIPPEHLFLQQAVMNSFNSSFSDFQIAFDICVDFHLFFNFKKNQHKHRHQNRQIEVQVCCFQHKSRSAVPAAGFSSFLFLHILLAVCSPSAPLGRLFLL